MSHIKTIDFQNPSTQSGNPTSLTIHYQADSDGEQITLEVLVDGVSIKPKKVTASKGTNRDTVMATLTRGTFKGKTVLVEATIMIDRDHGSSAFDNIKLV